MSLRWTKPSTISPIRPSRKRLIEIAENVATDTVQQQEVRKMAQTYAEVMIAKGRSEDKVEGRSEEARSLIMRMGKKKWGRVDTQTKTSLAAIMDVERLERLADRLFDASSWADLLETP